MHSSRWRLHPIMKSTKAIQSAPGETGPARPDSRNQANNHPSQHSPPPQPPSVNQNRSPPPSMHSSLPPPRPARVASQSFHDHSIPPPDEITNHTIPPTNQRPNRHRCAHPEQPPSPCYVVRSAWSKRPNSTDRPPSGFCQDFDAVPGEDLSARLPYLLTERGKMRGGGGMH